MELEPRFWLLSKYSNLDKPELDFPLGLAATTELRDAFAYVGLTFVEPQSKEELDKRIATLRAEIEAQNRYLTEMSKTGFRGDPGQFVGSKFVADIFQSGRQSFASRGR
jgi:hypothetical protein